MAAEKNEMKAVIYAQFNPIKTMDQLIDDRYILRLCIAAVLLLVSCC